MKPLNEIGFSQFKSMLSKAFPRIGVYYSQTRDAYYMQYAPMYPKKSAADFTVCLLFGCATPRVTLYANTEGILSTIKDYTNFRDLLNDLEYAE